MLIQSSILWISLFVNCEMSAPASSLAGEEALGMAGERLFTRRMNRRGPAFCCYPLWLLSFYSCRASRQGVAPQSLTLICPLRLIPRIREIRVYEYV